MKLSQLSVYCLSFVVAASGQTFKQHTIGESTQQFFAVATMPENKGLTSEYCRRYLSDPKVVEAYQRFAKHPTDLRAMDKSIDVTGCWDVRDALEGKDVEVGARFISEIGMGSATFHSKRLVLMDFSLPSGTPIEDVVSDISKELGEVKPIMSIDTVQNGFGATLQRRRAVWNTEKLVISAMEMRSFQHGDLGISVAVADSGYFKEKESDRQANRPNTIR